MIELLASVTVAQVKEITIILILLLVIWVWRRPRKYILNEAPDDAWWRDLRFWASGVLLLQVCIYLYF